MVGGTGTVCSGRHNRRARFWTPGTTSAPTRGCRSSSRTSCPQRRSSSVSKLKYELTHYISPWMAIFTALIALASIAYLPFVIAAVIFGVATGLAYSVEKDDRTRHAAFSAIDEPKPTKDRFCSDCGKEFILKSYQDGF